eukprot:scaffold2.g7013.t1
MATSGTAFAISVGIYAAIAAAILLLFSWWRARAVTKKFYAPKRWGGSAKRYVEGGPKPPPLKKGFFAWMGQVLRLSEAEVLRAAGMDAVVYLKMLRLGEALF